MPAQAYVQPVAGIAAGQIGPSAWNCRFYPCLFLSHFFHVYHVSILRGVIWYGTWLQGHSVTVAAAAAAVAAAAAAAVGVVVGVVVVVAAAAVAFIIIVIINITIIIIITTCVVVFICAFEQTTLSVLRLYSRSLLCFYLFLIIFVISSE
jgi:hypothetical protein